MRGRAFAVCVLVILWGAAAAGQAPSPTERQRLQAFAQSLGLHDVAGFVDAVETVRTAHRLPPGFVTKRAAKAHGWHGGGLCEAWPGHRIGGDVFHNYGGRLPDAPGRVYREADLDATCTSRGGKRLIFANDGPIYVTINHYNSFSPVP